MPSSPLINGSTPSDLTIRCGDTGLEVHRSVLTSASPYSRVLLSGHFAESKASTIELKEDDPESIKTLLAHFYGMSYLLKDEYAPVMESRPLKAFEMHSVKKVLQFYDALKVTADKYGALGLVAKIDEEIASTPALAPASETDAGIQLFADLAKSAYSNSRTETTLSEVLLRLKEGVIEAMSTCVDSEVRGKLQPLLLGLPELTSDVLSHLKELKVKAQEMEEKNQDSTVEPRSQRRRTRFP